MKKEEWRYRQRLLPDHLSAPVHRHTILDSSLFGIRFRFRAVTTHHGYDFRMFYFLESGTAFRLGYFSATNEAPFDHLFTHNIIYLLCLF